MPESDAAVRDPVTGAPAAFHFAGVHKAFGDHVVLDGLELVVPEGHVTVLVGRSGTGKSVTMKHVMGLVRPDRGAIWVGGEEITAMSPRRSRGVRSHFGIVFQQAALFDSMTALENVGFPLLEHTRLPRREVWRRARDLLAQVGLAGAEDRRPAELSGGMRKRVGLARALIREPKYLLYDEPTTGLDPILSSAMTELILETQARRPGITSMVITHDMQAALRLADKVAMLAEGRVFFEGDAQAFRTSEAPRIRQFLTGTPAGPEAAR